MNKWNKNLLGSMLAAVTICLSISGCGGVPAEKDAEPSESISQHISEYMVANPYFNPYNTLTDCDDEYIYCVQSQSENTQAGIYRRQISGGKWEHIYENDETPVEIISEDRGSTTLVIPGITSLTVHRDNLYFARLGDIYRMKNDGSDVIRTEYGARKDKRFPYALRVVGEVLYVGDSNEYNNGPYEEATAFYLSADPDLSVTYEEKAVNHINTAVRPWSVLLPKEWTLSKEYSLTLTTPAGNNLSIDTDYAPVLIDYQSLYALQVHSSAFSDEEDNDRSYTAESIIKQVGIDDLNTRKSTLSIPFESDSPVLNPAPIRWRNASNGVLYGFLNRFLYAYDTSTGTLKEMELPEELSYRPSIDIVGDHVFFRCTDLVVRCWNTADMSVCIVG